MDFGIHYTRYCAYFGKRKDKAWGQTRIRFKKGNCDLSNMLASFYTTTIPPGETVPRREDIRCQIFKLSTESKSDSRNAFSFRKDFADRPWFSTDGLA